VEVSHEAHIREWDDLRQWVNDDRANLRFGRRLGADADEWGRTKDPGSLLQGARLLTAKEWVAAHQDVPAIVREFVHASDAEEERALAKTLAYERELRETAEAREHAEVRSNERLRRALTSVTVAVVGLLLAVAAALVGVRVARQAVVVPMRSLH
jgi:hypothetical protein